jgi:hypothetical protein
MEFSTLYRDFPVRLGSFVGESTRRIQHELSTQGEEIGPQLQAAMVDINIAKDISLYL